MKGALGQTLNNSELERGNFLFFNFSRYVVVKKSVMFLHTALLISVACALALGVRDGAWGFGK